MYVVFFLCCVFWLFQSWCQKNCLLSCSGRLFSVTRAKQDVSASTDHKLALLPATVILAPKRHASSGLFILPAAVLVSQHVAEFQCMHSYINTKQNKLNKTTLRTAIVNVHSSCGHGKPCAWQLKRIVFRRFSRVPKEAASWGISWARLETLG